MQISFSLTTKFDRLMFTQNSDTAIHCALLYESVTLFCALDFHKTGASRKW